MSLSANRVRDHDLHPAAFRAEFWSLSASAHIGPSSKCIRALREQFVHRKHGVRSPIGRERNIVRGVLAGLHVADRLDRDPCRPFRDALHEACESPLGCHGQRRGLSGKGDSRPDLFDHTHRLSRNERTYGRRSSWPSPASTVPVASHDSYATVPDDGGPGACGPAALPADPARIPASHGRAVSCAVCATTSKVRQWAVTLIIGSVPVPALSCVPVYLALVSAGVKGRTASRLAPAGAQRREGIYPFFNLARGLSRASQDVVRGLRQSRQASRRLSHPHCSRNSANSRRHGPVSSMFGFTRTMRGSDDYAKRTLMSIVAEGINDAARRGNATSIDGTIHRCPGAGSETRNVHPTKTYTR